MRRGEQSNGRRSGTAPGAARRVGLARALSKLGYCSRSQAAEMIRAGRVRLNGAVRRDPETPVHLGRDRVDVEGGAVQGAERIYLMLNKPRGIVTTTSDERGRDSVYSCLGAEAAARWLAPVGRLDKASEGLLLLTNDTAWAARITAPETHLEKTYHVQVNAPVEPALLARMERGLTTADGEVLRARRATVLRRGEKNTWLEITLDEGRNRHIRRMLAALGLDVLRLVRISIGPLALGTLAKGASRPLAAHENRALDAAMGSAKRTAAAAAASRERNS